MYVFVLQEKPKVQFEDRRMRTVVVVEVDHDAARQKAAIWLHTSMWKDEDKSDCMILTECRNSMTPRIVCEGFQP